MFPYTHLSRRGCQKHNTYTTNPRFKQWKFAPPTLCQSHARTPIVDFGLRCLFISRNLRAQNPSSSDPLADKPQKFQATPSVSQCVEIASETIPVPPEESSQIVDNEYDFLRAKDQKDDHDLARLRTQENLSRILSSKKDQSWISWLANKIFFQSVSYNITGKVLYLVSKNHSERTEWRHFGIPQTFASWFAVSLIHVWMILVRMRGVGDKQMSRDLSQRVVDAFFLDIERGIVRKTNVTNPIILGKSNKQFLRSYYGSMAAYDEALKNGDSAFADALYRNFYAFDVSHTSAQEIESLVLYVRKMLHKLYNLSNEEFLSAEWHWDEPRA